MKHLLILAVYFMFAVSVTVFLVSVAGLARMRYAHGSPTRRRHRSRLSRLRAHLYVDESLRRPARTT
jgi:hypothetical protein